MTTELSTARADYLAANPKEQAIQTAALADIARSVTGLRDTIEKEVKKFAEKYSKDYWSVGVRVNEFIERLPGKKLTEDFYRQMKKELVDSKGRPMSRRYLNWMAEWARRFPDGEINSFAVQKMWRDLPLFTGDAEQVTLLPDTEGRGRPPYNPYDFFMELPARCAKEERDLSEALAKFEANEQFGPLTNLKASRPDLYAEVKKQLEMTLETRRKEATIVSEALKQLG
jgi:hypothetical protein